MTGIASADRTVSARQRPGHQKPRVLDKRKCKTYGGKGYKTDRYGNAVTLKVMM